MADLVYGTIASLDGYIADERGDFDWSMPDPEVHAFLNDLEQRTATDVYGRRLYEVMKVWETIDSGPPEELDWARLWRSRRKIVVSSTLERVESERTTLLRTLDAAELQRIKDESEGSVSIGGPTLAATAIRAGLVDEFTFFTSPVIIGGGLRALPDGVRLDLRLVDERRFRNGVVFTRYRMR